MDHIKTFKEVEGVIELIEYYIEQQNRYKQSSNLIDNIQYDEKLFNELENDLKYYNRISNKYLNKLIRGRV